MEKSMIKNMSFFKKIKSMFKHKEKAMFNYEEMLAELEVGQDYLVTFTNKSITSEYGNGMTALLVFLHKDKKGLNFYHPLWKEPHCLNKNLLFRIEEARAPHRLLWRNIEREV